LYPKFERYTFLVDFLNVYDKVGTQKSTSPMRKIALEVKRKIPGMFFLKLKAFPRLRIFPMNSNSKSTGLKEKKDQTFFRLEMYTILIMGSALD
jgi:hypothetical protein